MKYKCPGIIEDWCGDLPAGLGTPEPDTKCQIVTQTQLDRIEAKLDLLLEQKKPVKKRSAKKHTYDDKFLVIWKDYPNVYGSSKQKAYSAYKKRLSETKRPLELSVNIHIAVIQYGKFIRATGRYTMLAATFFGPDRHYENDWTVPDKTESMPKSNDDLVAWSANKGFRTPRAGESWSEYRQAVQQLYRNV